jgi:hypothetical protein
MSLISILWLIAVMAVAFLLGGLVPLVGHVLAACIVYYSWGSLVRRVIVRQVKIHEDILDAAPDGPEKRALEREINRQVENIKARKGMINLSAFVVATVTLFHPLLGLLALIVGGVAYTVSYVKG